MWILIIMIYGGGSSVHSIEFTSNEKCIVAGNKSVAEFQRGMHASYVCVVK